MARTPRIRAALCVVMLTLWLAALGASAQIETEPPGYRAAIDQAIEEFAARHFEEARAMFTRAHDLLPSARTLRGMGMAEFELRNYGECIRQLEAALASPVRPLDGALRADTEQLLARANDFVARFVLDAKPRASRLFIDGEALDVPTETPLLLQVGDHVIDLHAAGYQPERLRLSVKGGERQTLTVLFTKPVEAAPTAAPAARSLRKNPWMWTAVGVVVAGAATGAAIALTRGEAGRAEPYRGTANVGLTGP